MTCRPSGTKVIKLTAHGTSYYISTPNRLVRLVGRSGATPCSFNVTPLTAATIGPVWSGWVSSHTSNFFTWADAHFETMVNSASDVVTLQNELNQQQRA